MTRTYKDYASALEKLEPIRNKVYDMLMESTNRYLIDLYDYIKDTEVVYEIIQEVCKKVPDYNYKEHGEDIEAYLGGLNVQSKTLRKEKTIKGTYDYLLEVTQEYYKDIEFLDKIKLIRNDNSIYMENWFKPLLEYIEVELKSKMIELEHVQHNIQNNYIIGNNDNRKYEFSNVKDSNINLATDGSTITVNNNNLEEVVKLIKSLNIQVSKAENMSNEVRVELKESLEAVEEEITKEIPDKSKLTIILKGLGGYCKDTLGSWIKAGQPEKEVVKGITNILGKLLDNEGVAE